MLRINNDNDTYKGSVGVRRGNSDLLYYTFCCSLPENILLLTSTSNSLTQKYFRFIQLTFTSVDTQPFASKGIL